MNSGQVADTLVLLYAVYVGKVPKIKRNKKKTFSFRIETFFLFFGRNSLEKLSRNVHMV